MPRRPKNTEGERAGEKKKPKEECWDERLRLHGHARVVEAPWSGRDHPSWPLPKK